MNVVYAADNNYVYPLLVSLASLKAHNPTCNVFVLGNGLTDQNQEKLKQACVTLIDVSLPDIDITRLKHVTNTCLARFLIPGLIDIEKCLYLDCDTIINGGLAELYTIEINYMGAASDLNEKACINYFRALTGKVLTKYYNSGVLLLNVKALRGMSLYNDVLVFLNDFPQRIYADQDAINYLFDGAITAIDERFNYQDHFRIGKIMDKLIVHYSGDLKPWDNDYRNTYGQQLFTGYAGLVSK